MPNLHSIMLLLYLYRDDGTKITASYLHSIMLLLYLLQLVQEDKTTFIYIPLCFYFIKNGTRFISSIVSDLHSIMLLLYQSQVFRITLYYGKFTFHYASTLSCCPDPALSKAVIIYIPLCFYFILLSQKI